VCGPSHIVVACCVARSILFASLVCVVLLCNTPGVYLLVLENNQYPFVSFKKAPQVPHVTVVYSDKKDDASLFDTVVKGMDYPKYVRVNRVAESVFQKDDGTYVYDVLLMLDDASHQHLDRVRKKDLPPHEAHWITRAPHITCARTYDKEEHANAFASIQTDVEKLSNGIDFDVVGVCTSLNNASGKVK